jgi:hypothetical protein
VISCNFFFTWTSDLRPEVSGQQVEWFFRWLSFHLDILGRRESCWSGATKYGTNDVDFFAGTLLAFGETNLAQMEEINDYNNFLREPDYIPAYARGSINDCERSQQSVCLCCSQEKTTRHVIGLDVTYSGAELHSKVEMLNKNKFKWFYHVIPTYAYIYIGIVCIYIYILHIKNILHIYIL